MRLQPEDDGVPWTRRAGQEENRHHGDQVTGVEQADDCRGVNLKPTPTPKVSHRATESRFLLGLSLPSSDRWATCSG